MNFHYSVEGLEEPVHLNVLSLEQETKVDCTFKFERTGSLYRVLWCDKPQATAAEAALLALNGQTTLRVALENRGPGVPSCPKHYAPMQRTTEWDLNNCEFFYCPESDCKQRYSIETGHITTDDLPSRSY